MESDKVLGCIQLQGFIRLLGILLVVLVLFSLGYSIRFAACENPLKYIMFALFTIYVAPATAFLMMMYHKEDLRSRKRFHCAYLCSVATNCMFRLFFVVMIVTYYSFYIRISLTHFDNQVNAWIPSRWAIATAFVLLSVELMIETLIRKQILLRLKQFYEKVDSLEDADYLRVLDQEDD